jgi:hypothetical protein
MSTNKKLAAIEEQDMKLIDRQVVGKGDNGSRTGQHILTNVLTICQVLKVTCSRTNTGPELQHT